MVQTLSGTEIARVWPWLGTLDYEIRSVSGVTVLLPPLCVVGAGEFIMGANRTTDPQSFGNEAPPHIVTLPTYRISRYPVTVAEWASYTWSGGQRPPRLTEREWERSLAYPGNPVVGVTVAAAHAYATWLQSVTGMPWRLPTEEEWEKAARWDPARRHARIFPWGDQFDPARCNSLEAGIGTTTPIGTYAFEPHDGSSPCGAQDMAGNVREYTVSKMSRYSAKLPETSERIWSRLLRDLGDLNRGGAAPLATPDSYVLRGGSFASASVGVRTTCRTTAQVAREPVRSTGFRLVLGQSPELDAPQ